MALNRRLPPSGEIRVRGQAAETLSLPQPARRGEAFHIPRRRFALFARSDEKSTVCLFVRARGLLFRLSHSSLRERAFLPSPTFRRGRETGEGSGAVPAPLRRASCYWLSRSAVCFSIAVPLKKFGLTPPKKRTALAKVRSRRSS